MSAFIVCNGHIDVLVNASAQFAVTEQGAGHGVYRTLGQMLWDENVHSVDCRYHDHNERPRYVLTTTEGTLDPLAVLKAIDCYRYQSCEHPGWDDSEAQAWVARLREAIYQRRPELARQVPSRYEHDRLVPAYLNYPAYDALPWEFDSVDDALLARTTE